MGHRQCAVHHIRQQQQQLDCAAPDSDSSKGTYCSALQHARPHISLIVAMQCTQHGHKTVTHSMRTGQQARVPDSPASTKEPSSTPKHPACLSLPVSPQSVKPQPICTRRISEACTTLSSSSRCQQCTKEPARPQLLCTRCATNAATAAAAATDTTTVVAAAAAVMPVLLSPNTS